MASLCHLICMLCWLVAVSPAAVRMTQSSVLLSSVNQPLYIDWSTHASTNYKTERCSTGHGNPILYRVPHTGLDVRSRSYVINSSQFTYICRRRHHQSASQSLLSPRFIHLALLPSKWLQIVHHWSMDTLNLSDQWSVQWPVSTDQVGVMWRLTVNEHGAWWRHSDVTTTTTRWLWRYQRGQYAAAFFLQPESLKADLKFSDISSAQTPALFLSVNVTLQSELPARREL